MSMFTTGSAHRSSRFPISETGLRPITIRHLSKEGATNQSQVVEPSPQGSKLYVGLTGSDRPTWISSMGLKTHWSSSRYIPPPSELLEAMRM